METAHPVLKRISRKLFPLEKKINTVLIFETRRCAKSNGNEALLFFFFYINELNKAIKFSDVYHFADDTNPLGSDKSSKGINKHINHDLKLLNIWRRVNKTLLNASETEIILFRPKP